jgi:hypothetical protein
MKIALIFTNDWELFGDGSGDFYDLQYNPLYSLLDLLKEYSANITIMAETGQQFAFKNSENQYYQNCAHDWEQILKKVISNGSDVQLHYHPQWLKYEFKSEKWLLNMSEWKLSSLSLEDMLKILGDSKEYLEEILREVDSDYRCRIFRAGSYCIQPSKEPIKALNQIGIKADSSVTKGLKNEGFFDYTLADSNLIPFRVSDELVEKKGKNELIEFPIYSEEIFNSEAIKKYFPKLYYSLFLSSAVPTEEINWLIEKERIKNKKYPRSNRFYKKNEGKNLSWYLSKILSKSAVQLDYDNLPATAFVEILKRIIKNNTYKEAILPVVASGHLKDIQNLNNIEKILKMIKNEISENVVFWTLSKALNYWEKRI